MNVQKISSPEVRKELAVFHRNFAILFFVLLLLSIIVTFVGWRLSLRTIKLEEQEKFNTTAVQITSWISSRTLAYHTILHGLASFIENSNGITLDSWANYVKENDISTYYPGVSAFGYSEYVPQQKLGEYLSAMKKIYPQFTITPSPDTETEHNIVSFIEPYVGREKAVGFDQSSEAERKRVIDEVRDTGKIDNTKPVDLVTVPSKGFFLIIPIYKQGVALSSVEQRRAAFIGTAFASFRGDDPFESLFNNESIYKDVDIEVYDDASPTPDALLYDSDPSISALHPKTDALTKSVQIQLESHQWTVVMATKPSFVSTQIQQSVIWIPFLRAGIAIAILMFLTFYQLHQHQKLVALGED